jgi:chaperonin GroEL
MAQDAKDNKLVYYGTEARQYIFDGAEELYNAVTTTYGIKGLNVLIEKTYGRPMLTRDGVTVAKEVYFSDRPKNMGAQLLSEASQNTNRIAGDGTTATVALTYNLLKEANQAVAAGKNPMEVRDIITKDSQVILDKIDELARPVEKGQLEQVAAISSGDPALGKLISEAVEYVGKDGGLITEKAHVSGVEREYVEGYYIQKGFTAITDGKKELTNCFVIISAKRISSSIDALELLQKTAEATKTAGNDKLRIAFVGEFEGEAYQTIVANIIQGNIDAVVVASPSTGDMGTQYLEDIAIYTGGKIIAEGDNIKNFDAEYIGQAKRVVCTQSTTSIFDGEKVLFDYDVRIKELQDRIEAEENEVIAEKIRDRLAKLQGKIALFRIGGATDTEREEKEFRVEDAIQSTRAAHSQGVVAGGGITLVELSKLDISPIFKNALTNTFKRLLNNAGLSADVKLNEVLASEYPNGFNLRESDKLVNVIESGVLDPVLVVKQIVENATSIAGNMVTVGVVITFQNKED